MTSYWKAIVFGLLLWLIPFLVSMAFYGPGGTLNINEVFFKTIMVDVGSLVGAFFIYQYFKHVTKNPVREGFIIGIFWFVLNIAIDLLVLLPLSKVSIGTYFETIGLRYLNIFFMCVMAGMLIQYKKKNG